MNASAVLLSQRLVAGVGSVWEGTVPDIAADDDLQDIAAALNGAEAAYARLVTRHERAVYAQMTRFSRDPLVCRELVQEAFVEAFLGLSSYRASAPFLHWLRRIATRTGYRYWGREARARRVRGAVAAGAPQYALPPETPSDAAALIFEILSHMEAKDRLVLTLFYFDACTTAEIAERMGWSETLVRVRMHRSRNRLKKLIESNPVWRDAL